MSNNSNKIMMLAELKARDYVAKLNKRYTVLNKSITEKVFEYRDNEVKKYDITIKDLELFVRKSFLMKDTLILYNYYHSGTYTTEILNNLESLNVVKSPVFRLQRVGIFKIGGYNVNLDIFCLDEKGGDKRAEYYIDDNIRNHVSRNIFDRVKGLYD